MPRWKPRRPPDAEEHNYGDPAEKPPKWLADQVETEPMVPGDNPLPIPPEVIMPSDAVPLKDVIDRRFKHLLSTSMDPKDMTKALEAAIKWYEATNDKAQQWGADLGRSTLTG